MTENEMRAEAIRLRTQERLGVSAIAKRLRRGVSTVYDWLDDDGRRVWWADEMPDHRRARWYKQQSDDQIAVLKANNVWYGPPETRPAEQRVEPSEATPAPPPRCETPGQMVHNIIAACAEHAGISVDTLAGPCRRRALSDARMAAAYLIHNHSHLGVVAIGRKFGRDHSTIMSALKRVDDDLERDGERFGDILLYVRERLGLHDGGTE